ncbi:cation/H(+) antiporter 24, partial [Jatropha curcas]|uniref:cation/H(+) antiporter 24 n=1 Tax=Jatropha curcas TaxID=180498 RepID=UPI0018948F95
MPWIGKTWLIRILLKPLKQPRIVSDIIGGMFIGPSVLGCNKKFTASVLPDNAQFLLRNVGVMGFMFFLFLAGVKMDLGLIKKSGKKHLWTALVGVFFPFLSVGVVGAI